MSAAAAAVPARENKCVCSSCGSLHSLLACALPAMGSVNIAHREVQRGGGIIGFFKAISLDLRAGILLESKPLSCVHLKLFCSRYFHFTNKEGRELNFQRLSTSISKRKLI